MSTVDLFDAIPEADPREVPVAKSTRRREAPITKLGTTDPPARKKQVNLNPQQTDFFKARGWPYAKCEYKHHISGKKHDLWTFGDWLTMDDAPGSLIVQTTTEHNLKARLRKAEAAPELVRWLERGNRFEGHGWHQPGGPGTRWQVRRVRIVLDGDTLRREDVTE